MFAHSAAKQNQAIDILIKAVECGEISRDAIDAAGRRLDLLCEHFVRPPHYGPLQKIVGCQEHHQIVSEFLRARDVIDPTLYTPNAVA
jgi:hypothetical protein